jgi:hypothetical protein
MFHVWVDDVRFPPEDHNLWFWARSTDEAKTAIRMYEKNLYVDTILIDLDHDAGDYAEDGGDYIEILNWLEREGIADTGYFFRIHSQNPVGVENMRRIIQHNGWREIR